MNSQVVIINLLRGLAAMMVCFFHFSHFGDQSGTLFNPDGFMWGFGEFCANGVYIFFVISGFVIPYSLEKLAYTWRKFPLFFLKRFIRIEIPFLASIALLFGILTLFYLMLGWDFKFDPKQFLANVFYLVPFTKHEWYNIIYWTLAVEFQFYLLMGLFFLLLVHSVKWLKYIFIILFLASSLYFKTEDNIFFFAPLFTLGIVLFLFRQKYISLPEFLFLSLISCGMIWYTNDSWVIAFVCLITQVLILYVEFEHKITNFFGEISFSLYLIHGMVGGNFVFVFKEYFLFPYGNFVLVFTMVLVAVLCSTVFWYVIERPSKKWSKRMKL